MMSVRKICGLALVLSLAGPAVYAQKDAPIVLVNPSFEDVPKSGEAPNGWFSCGFPNETPPDVQPGFFKVTQAPTNGASYLGLVVRDNETWEGVSQRLSRPLEKDQCYEMTIDLCRSEIYMSKSRTTDEDANYTTPVKLIVYGGNNLCDKREVLFETPLITNYRWLGYTLRLNPKNGSYAYIYFEAYYKTPVLFPYNGHILLDNASPIRSVPCTPDKMIVKKPEPPKTPPATASATRTTAKGGATAPVTYSKTSPPPAAAPAKMERKNLKKGDIIRLEKLYFDANQYVLKEECIPSLTELFNFLDKNPDVSIEVSGHTNNKAKEDFAIELSTNRAKAVANWLIDKGIDPKRIQFKGYGWTMPIEPNTTPEGRKKNQRVEVKILNING